MTNVGFSRWLSQNGLTEEFTTYAGYTLYTNKAKKFGVIKKSGECAVQTFYLDDIVEFKTYDDENIVAEWSATSWRLGERNTRYSTNEVYMKIRLKNQQVIRLQIFRAKNGNITRGSKAHNDLINYACKISQIVYNCAAGK